MRLLVLLGLVLGLLLGMAVYREIRKKEAVQKEIRALQEEAAKISRENSDITERIAYLESRDYKEREAKEKLNLQKPGETVVVITPGPSKEEIVENSNREKRILEIAGIQEKSNPEKWWDYFFKY